MVLLRHPKERLITRAKIEGFREGYAEGKTESARKMHAKWSEWFARRIEHERRGEPFDDRRLRRMIANVNIKRPRRC